MEWQPIEIAPRDGTWILVYSPANGHLDRRDMTYWLVRWFPSGWCWMDQDDVCLEDYDPTHWMPLPDPPEHHQ